MGVVGKVVLGFLFIGVTGFFVFIANYEPYNSTEYSDRGIDNSYSGSEPGKYSDKETVSDSNSYTPRVSTPKITLTSYEPTIGMTANEVHDSSWAYPNDVSKTTTAGSTTEMWVYPEGNYIHFKDGKVISIVEGY